MFLKKVEKVKQKILDGTFGVCEDCGSQISQKRFDQKLFVIYSAQTDFSHSIFHLPKEWCKAHHNASFQKW